MGVRSPKDKPNAEGTVGNISTWITAALRHEQFFSLAELNRAIRPSIIDAIYPHLQINSFKPLSKRYFSVYSTISSPSYPRNPT